jgi:hypothetical protein
MSDRASRKKEERRDARESPDARAAGESPPASQEDIILLEDLAPPTDVKGGTGTVFGRDPTDR